MLKKTSLLITLIVPVFFLFQITTNAKDFYCVSSFKDIQEDTNLCHYVNFLDFNRVISGYSDLTYRQSENVTREQFAKYIVNAFSINEDISNMKDEDFFPDVDKENKFFEYIHILKKIGVISGFPDGTFKPSETVNRGAVLKFITNAAKIKNPDLFNETAGVTFEDISENHTFYEYISRGVKASQGKHVFNQITNPNNPKYRSADPISREELAKMVANAMIYGDFYPNSNYIDLEQAILGVQNSQFEESEGIEYRRFEKQGMTIVSTNKKLDFVYRPMEAPALRDVATGEGFKVLANASYFGGHYETVYENPPVFDNSKKYVKVVDTGSFLNVRETASTGATIIGKLYDGDVVEMIEEQGDWYKIVYDSKQNGWIHSSFSIVFDPKDILSGNFGRVENTGSYLRVRLEAKADSEEVGRVYDGDIVDILSETNNWFKIKLNNIEGWASSEFITKIDGETAYRERNQRKVLNRVHAGYLNLYGEVKTPLKTREETNQLTHIIDLEPNIKITNINNFKIQSSVPNTIQFQTGPLLVENNKVQRDFIYESKNGRTKHKRTALIISDDGYKHIVIIEKEVSLSELSHLLLHLENFKGKQLNIINLDGGSSTSLYSKEFPVFNYGEEKSLPILIGIK